jgi:hypothetical protein
MAPLFFALFYKGSKKKQKILPTQLSTQNKNFSI